VFIRTRVNFEQGHWEREGVLWERPRSKYPDHREAEDRSSYSSQEIRLIINSSFVRGAQTAFLKIKRNIKTKAITSCTFSQTKELLHSKENSH
jgi:hypothetical protein